MHKISFKMTFQDRIEEYKIGLAHLTLLYRLIWGSLLLMFVAIPVSTLLLGGYPYAWPPARLPSRPLLTSIPLASYFLVSALIGSLTRRHAVSVQQHSLIIQMGLLTKSMAWREMTTIVDTGSYFCFCRNVPAALAVPKLAFATSQDADDFFETALTYWHKAKGTRPQPNPDTSGTWPPAPCVSNSRKPGDEPEG